MQGLKKGNKQKKINRVAAVKRGFASFLSYCLFVGCLTSKQHASVSRGWTCEDNFSCCHTETKVADQTFYLTQSQYTDTRPASPSTDPLMPAAWQVSHWSANFCHWYGLTPEKSWHKQDLNPGSSALQADALTTGPTRSSYTVDHHMKKENKDSCLCEIYV